MILTDFKLKDFFPKFTIPCINNFMLIVECIMISRTVCLYKCRDKVQQLTGDKKNATKKKEIKDVANENSCYARLIRFFKMKNVGDFIEGIRLLMTRITEMDFTYLIVDRTNWQRGKKNFNLLTIGTLMSSIFIPFYWIQLDKKGNSNIEDRKSLINSLARFAEKAGKSIAGSIVIADREFIGQLWFEFLLSVKLSFVIRLKEKMYFELQTSDGKKNSAWFLPKTR